MPLIETPNRERRVLTDHGRPFARHPDARLTASIERVAAMLPFPSQTVRLGRVGAVPPAVQRFDTSPVLDSEAVDLWHERAVWGDGPQTSLYVFGPGATGRAPTEAAAREALARARL